MGKKKRAGSKSKGGVKKAKRSGSKKAAWREGSAWWGSSIGWHAHHPAADKRVVVELKVVPSHKKH